MQYMAHSIMYDCYVTVCVNFFLSWVWNDRVYVSDPKNATDQTCFVIVYIHSVIVYILSVIVYIHSVIVYIHSIISLLLISDKFLIHMHAKNNSAKTLT